MSVAGADPGIVELPSPPTWEQALGATLLRVNEQERRRIASWVHDESIQGMVLAGLRLEALRERLDDPALVRAARDIEEIVIGLVARLRNLIFELDPTDLEAVGLERVLRSYVGQYFRDSDVAFSVRGRFSSEPSEDTRRTLYRLVHEAVVNARKHAGAAHVTVTLKSEADAFVVTVEDDGSGFDSESAASLCLVGHIGLRLMTYRSNLAGGSVIIDSSPGRGTKVVVRLPASPVIAALNAAAQGRR